MKHFEKSHSNDMMATKRKGKKNYGNLKHTNKRKKRIDENKYRTTIIKINERSVKKHIRHSCAKSTVYELPASMDLCKHMHEY